MTKEDLEKKKLELEIKKLNSSWYGNIEFWKVLIPTIAVLASLYFAFGKGILDSEKSKLEIQKEQLRLDISKFEEIRNELTFSISVKDSIKTNLEKQIKKYELQKINLRNRISDLNQKLGIKDNEIEQVNNIRLSDKKFYQQELLKQYNSEKSRLEELGNLKNGMNKKDVLISELIAEKEYFNKKVKLNEIEKNELLIEKHEASAAELKKQINNYDITKDRLKEKYEAEKKRINQMSPEELVRYWELIMLKQFIN